MHDNFCRIHQTLRVTPAMEAGITDHVLSLDASGQQSLKLKTISAKPVGVEAASQRLIPTGKRSGLLTHVAATESGSSAARACEFKYLVALSR
jgi:hypothetical protein